MNEKCVNSGKKAAVAYFKASIDRKDCRELQKH
jgi:hypothetical protein